MHGHAGFVHGLQLQATLGSRSSVAMVCTSFCNTVHRPGKIVKGSKLRRWKPETATALAWQSMMLLTLKSTIEYMRIMRVGCFGSPRLAIVSHSLPSPHPNLLGATFLETPDVGEGAGKAEDNITSGFTIAIFIALT